MLARTQAQPYISPKEIEEDAHSLSAPILSPVSTQKGLSHLVAEFLTVYVNEHRQHLPIGSLYDTVIAEVERPLIEIMLKLYEGNQKKTAEVLGMNRNTLRKKIKELGLKIEGHAK